VDCGAPHTYTSFCLVALHGLHGASSESCSPGRSGRLRSPNCIHQQGSADQASLPCCVLG
jgi:hypothetical protein